jgi:outer membrane lipoprotein-sorting protein
LHAFEGSSCLFHALVRAERAGQVAETMKAFTLNNSTGLPGKSALCAACLLASLALSGCVRTHSVSKTVLAPNVMDATLEQLNGRLQDQYSAVKTINAKVTIAASTGGRREGEVQEIPSFSGFILLRKPSDLEVIMQLPLVGSLALEMVADGTNFKLLIPPKKIAREGSEELTKPSPKGFENLRPKIIRDALQVPPVGKDETVARTLDSRILPPAPGKKEATEEPDYDLTVLRAKQGNEMETIRVIHISRVTLKPYRQDIYDKTGHIVEVVNYEKYQKFGDIDFPMSILITMPLDEYSMKIDIGKLALNQQIDDEQFVLKFPEGMAVEKMP